MKKLNMYRCSVNLHGPHSSTKSGSGMWYVCETSEKNAKRALHAHFVKNNLMGSPDSIKLSLTDLDEDILPRGACMKRSEYADKILQKKEAIQNKYKFAPKKSEKGMLLHKVIREPKEYKEIRVPGAVPMDTYPDGIEDCGELHDIEGVTYKGKPLSMENLGELIESLQEV